MGRQILVKLKGTGPPASAYSASPGDHDDDLIEVPFVARAGQPPPDLVGQRLAELPGPLPHGLVADDDATGGQHFLDHAQAEREAEVEPDRVADDLRREPVTGVGGTGGRRHLARLLGLLSHRKPKGQQLDGAHRPAPPHTSRRALTHPR